MQSTQHVNSVQQAGLQRIPCAIGMTCIWRCSPRYMAPVPQCPVIYSPTTLARSRHKKIGAGKADRCSESTRQPRGTQISHPTPTINPSKQKTKHPAQAIEKSWRQRLLVRITSEGRGPHRRDPREQWQKGSRGEGTQEGPDYRPGSVVLRGDLRLRTSCITGISSEAAQTIAQAKQPWHKTRTPRNKQQTVTHPAGVHPSIGRHSPTESLPQRGG